MGADISVTLLANAGLVIRYRGTTLLLDGLYARQGHQFSNLPYGCFEKMKKGAPPFLKIDYLLFSHLHPDHFSPTMAADLLEQRQVSGVFFPDTPDAAVSEMKVRLCSCGQKFTALRPEEPDGLWKLTEHITLRPLFTRHLGAEYWDVPHISYLIDFDGRALLLTGDVDYTFETFSVLQDLPLHAVFLTPLFFHAMVGRRFFHGKLRTDQLCLYHLPFAGEDYRWGRMMAEKACADPGASNWNVTMLERPFQRIIL